MPLYEYVCPKGHLSTALRPLAEHLQPTKCACGETASRVLSATRTDFAFADKSARKGNRK